MKEFKKDDLKVKILETRNELGSSAAEVFVKSVNDILTKKDFANIVFAAAPSQNEFLKEISVRKIEWHRINAFHMDEYIGLDPHAPQSFANFLKQRLFNKVKCKEVHFINGNARDPHLECKRYADLLINYPTDLVCLGIGENAHLAFNDPPVANFLDPELVKIVELDEYCRMQQVNDGCFTQINEVPKTSITMTIPALMKANYAIIIVPGERKANAVFNTLKENISEKCPSTILRRHKNAILFLDKDSAGLL